MTTQLDRRELIPMDYSLLDTDQLEHLKASIMHSVIQSDIGQQALHHELTQIRLVLASRRIVERETLPLPLNADMAEYPEWELPKDRQK